MLVGLSGGVDSAVAAHLLRRSGHDVRAATLLLWGDGTARSCCSPDAVARARASAQMLGIPFAECELRERFSRLVVEPYIRSYLAGETPNPCVDCNRFRLADLLDLARRSGAAHIATGHYARVVWREGEPYLARGCDRVKDQSYMLWRVTPDILAHLVFPLGELTKAAVRTLAVAATLPVADQPESQEACFAPAGPRRFLSDCGVTPRPGDIVDTHGAVIGAHQGQWNFTVGQRRGLGVAHDSPLYVLERRGDENRVVVGTREQLTRREFEVRELVDRGLSDGRGLTVQVRYRAAGVAVAGIESDGEGRGRVMLEVACEGVAPGQSAVFYDSDVVVGGGVISGPEGL